MTLSLGRPVPVTLIITLSIVIPALVGFIYTMPKEMDIEGLPFFVPYQPAFHATLNSLTAIILILGYYFIRTKNQKAHMYCMLSAIGLSTLFLTSYVLYHSLAETSTYGGTGMLKNIYFFILISHISLAIVIVPMVLITVSRALRERFDKHKIIARWTLPLWLYVAITGVVVYFMISPYYPY